VRFRKEQLPPASTFYRAEFGKSLGRPARNWARTTCRLHHGDNPYSFCVNLQTGGYYCHSCGARGGDVVSYVMQRDHITFKDACVLLKCWDDKATVNQDAARRHRQEKQREQQRIADGEARVRAFRLDLRDEIHADQQIINEISRSLALDPENDELWSCLSLAWESREITEAEYMAEIEAPYGR